jgi:hypothetical protein
MARKFITSKELAFIDRINHELIQNVVGQSVIYYAISVENTEIDTLYNESVDKVWYSPVEINARVEWENPTVDTTQLSLDSKYSCNVFFHDTELIDRNVNPREGDFLEFGSVVFEITSVTRPQLVYGQVNKKIQVMCRCVPSREGQFQIHNDSAKFVDRTHPVEPSEC